MPAFNQKSLLKTCNDEGEAMMGLNDFFDGVVHADEELPEGSDENSGKPFLQTRPVKRSTGVSFILVLLAQDFKGTCIKSSGEEKTLCVSKLLRSSLA